MVEVCAGSAILSAEAQKAGFQVFPLDHSHNRFKPFAAIFQVDLSSPHSLELLVQFFKEVQPIWCHFGLPCGTCSRAREKALSAELRGQGAPEPRPLRAAHALMGLDGLTVAEQQRVDAANLVYKNAVVLLFILFQIQAIVSLENPERSWLWALLAFLIKQRGDNKFSEWYFGMDDVTFDACMHGGSFPKTTRLKSSRGVFKHLEAKCSGDHPHANWTVRRKQGRWHFDTADEAIYPRVLAKRMVQAVVDQFQPAMFQFTYKTFRLDVLLQAGVQHRRHRQLIPEYVGVQWSQTKPEGDHTKILSSPWDTGAEDEGEKEGEKPESNTHFKVGIFHNPMQHLEKALQLHHPSLSNTVVPDALRWNIFRLFTEGCHATAMMRTNGLKAMMAMKEQLRQQEEELKSKMPDHIKGVVKGKALCLFRKLLEETNFPDMRVCEMMEQGVGLTGFEPESNLFDKKFQPPSMTVQQLNHQAKWRRMQMMSQPMTSDEMEQREDLERESMTEVDAGFLKGPFTVNQISEMLQSDDWSLSKRFALYQGEERKVRIIDNYKDSGINQAFGSSSYIALQDTDFVVGFLKFLMQVMTNECEVNVTLSDGRMLRGSWHSSFADKPALLGRCVDLSKAYKQVAINGASLMHGVLGYKVADAEWRLFMTHSLPFGASASVFAFNKISRALWHILTHKFGILASVFYDDYPCFEFLPLASHTTKFLDGFFDVLGWKHAVTGKKAAAFDLQMQALGVQYDLEGIWQGQLVVQNKPGRLERILQLTKEFNDNKKGEGQIAATIGGLLNFSGGFVLGHSLKPATQLSYRWMSPSRPPGSLKAELCDLIRVLIHDVKPKKVTVNDIETPVLIYTDGAFENEVGTWGALVIDPYTKACDVFAGSVPSHLTRFWIENVGQQIICEVEMYAYICVRWHLRAALDGRLGICFIDNEACRMSLVKRNSSSTAMLLLTSIVSIVDANRPFGAWFERVPSFSNLADMPSRGKSADLCRLVNGCDRGDIVLPPFIFTFLMSGKFQSDLATVISFEAQP